MTNDTIIIGVIGVAGSGKTLVARHLVEQYGFRRMRFAEPLKRMLKCLGLTDEELDGSAKQQAIERFGGCTPRHLMQTLGTDWGRRMIHSDIWVNTWKRECAELGGRIVVDDVRFPNEAAAVRDMTGSLWRVYRPGLVTMDHASERSQKSIQEDQLLNNATNIPDLIKSIDWLMSEKLGSAAVET